MFNEICINEEMLPKYTYTYIYIQIKFWNNKHLLYMRWKINGPTNVNCLETAYWDVLTNI